MSKFFSRRVCIGLIWLRTETCEHGKEAMGSIKCEKNYWSAGQEMFTQK
jgi:hypothetical protein